MVTVIYVDTVFLLNSILDGLLLRGAGLLCAVPVSPLRLLAGAGAGGGYAVLVFLPGLGFLSLWPVRILWGAGMVCLTFGFSRKLVRITAVFFGLSAALAGGVLLLSTLSDSALSYPRGIPVTLPDWKGLILIGVCCYLAVSLLVRRLIPAQGQELIPAVLQMEGREVSLTLRLDTGCLLTDPAGGQAAAVVAQERILPLLPVGLRNTVRSDDPVGTIAALHTSELARRLTLLRYSGVGAPGGLLLAIRTDSGQYGDTRIHRPLVALAPRGVFGADCDGVIGQI